jgi:tetratricopeptide (TPR) repeat protein
VALAPRLGPALNNLGNVLRLQGRLDEAMACYQRALDQDSRRVMAWVNMGRLLQERGQKEEAARCYCQAEALEPNTARFHANLGSLAAECQDHEAAAYHYRQALAADPGLAEAHHGLGLALLAVGLLDPAEVSLRAAIRIKAAAGPWVALARLEAERGDFDRSCQSARQALALRPKLADALCQLAQNLTDRLPETDIRLLQGLLDQKYLGDALRSRLHFALAGVLDPRGRYAEAAALLEIANALQSSARAARGLSYDAGGHSRFIERMISAFTPELLARGSDWGDPDPRPTFVVGLPRSGTTLVEQILACHREVHGAGELADLHVVFHSLPEVVRSPVHDPFSALKQLDRATLRNAARRYLERLDLLAPPTATRVIDKMPNNIHFLGLIALLWPKARIIVCTRDLRDVAVSCWQTGFATIQWANNPDHIARRFLDHERLLEHWKSTPPLNWLEVSYEALVHDLEGQARRMIDFLGLEWDSGCLAFPLKRRVVRTASAAQVRQPIHARSVGRWRHYESLLPRLFQALERHGLGGTPSGLASTARVDPRVESVMGAGPARRAVATIAEGA